MQRSTGGITPGGLLHKENDSEVVATPAAGETGGTAKLFSESTTVYLFLLQLSSACLEQQ
jgi:hypothetical protein